MTAVIYDKIKRRHYNIDNELVIEEDGIKINYDPSTNKYTIINSAGTRVEVTREKSVCTVRFPIPKDEKRDLEYNDEIKSNGHNYRLEKKNPVRRALRGLLNLL